MSIGLAPKSGAADLADLLQSHEELMKELDSLSSEFAADAGARADFEARVTTFLERLKECVPNADSTEAVGLVHRMAADWQLKFTTVLRTPRNIFDELEISRIPEAREPTLNRPAPLTLEAVVKLVEKRAFEISAKWKLEWVSWLLDELKQHPEVIHQGTLMPPARTSVHDWTEACASFACDVLDGRIDLVLQLSLPGMGFLGNVWLEDVKRTKAFLTWKSVGAGQPRDDISHYFEACRDIRKRVMDRSLKGSPTSFAPIAEWIENELLEKNFTLAVGKTRTQDLIRRKAERLWERTRCQNSDWNWQRAEQYVRRFYENVIPAVMDRNEEAVEQALQATAIDGDWQEACEITHALEAALVAYFFDPEQMCGYFEGHRCYL